MGHIWRALVAEPKKTTDEFFDDIMEDLLTQAGSRLWRSRESSCLALADVVQGRKYSEVSSFSRRSETPWHCPSSWFLFGILDLEERHLVSEKPSKFYIV